MRNLLHLFVGLLALGTAAASASENGPSGVRFNRDIRPILSDKCFQCHGPDSQSRKGDLRLDRFESDGESQGAESVIVAGDPDASEILRRIESRNPAERMPPDAADRHLSSDEMQKIRNWLEQDGKYENHWAFIRPERPSVPTVTRVDWPKNPIDNFVLKRLENEKLSVSNRADFATLFRRVSLDLIGLPPDLAVLDSIGDRSFESDYANFVERLLKSPRYGEHWATMWLDAARYADTNGYNNDTPRYNWPYRDWVINALNENMPYDEFTVAQLAGDLLPEAKTEDILATGFNRNHMVNNETGSIDEEFRVEYVTDRVEVVNEHRK